MLALPCAAGVLTPNTVPSSRPSASLAVSVPVSAVSSAPTALVSPPMVVASLAGVTVTVTVAVSVMPAGLVTV